MRNHPYTDELTRLKNLDVAEFKRDNSVFDGLTDESIKELYSEFSFMYSASWLTTDKEGRTKGEFLKWCTTAPIDKFRKG